MTRGWPSHQRYLQSRQAQTFHPVDPFRTLFPHPRPLVSRLHIRQPPPPQRIALLACFRRLIVSQRSRKLSTTLGLVQGLEIAERLLVRSHAEICGSFHAGVFLLFRNAESLGRFRDTGRWRDNPHLIPACLFQRKAILRTAASVLLIPLLVVITSGKNTCCARARRRVCGSTTFPALD